MSKLLGKLFRGIGRAIAGLAKALKAAFTQRVMERVIAGVCIAAILAMCGVIKPF
jgi:hypothetical protein